MIKLLTQFIDICRFRLNPQDLPSSYVLKYSALLSYMAIGLMVALLNQPLAQALVATFVDAAMMLGLAYAGLWVRGFTGRTTQTITALAGTGAILGVIGYPIMVWLHSLDPDQPSMASLLLLALIVWNVMIVGHILRHALSLPYWAGVGISVFYMYTTIRVMSALFIAGT